MYSIASPTQARSKKALERFLNVAAELLANNQFEETGISQIAQLAESSVGTFYRLLGDKDVLLYAVHQHFVEQSRTAVVRDEAGVPGSGLVCFGSFAFADDPGDSVLVVPEVVVGRRGRQTWVTTTSAAALSSQPVLTRADEPVPPTAVTFSDGAMSGAAWETVVAEAVRRINAGELEKVVLARDLVATAGEDVDVRWPLRRLVERAGFVPLPVPEGAMARLRGANTPEEREALRR